MSKVFVMTNQATRNQIWVYDRAPDGSLTPPNEAFMFSSGGDGNGQPTSTADPLGSQGSLAMTPDHLLLIAANAGTNDVTSFTVGDSGALTPRATVSSGGTRPVSVAISGDLVYVLNQGGSIAGLKLGAEGALTPVASGPRPVERGATEIKFTPDGQHLVVVNRSPFPTPPTSSIDVFPVDHTDGRLGGIRTTLTVQGAPFGGSFLGRDNVGRDVLAVTGLDNRIALYGIGPLGVAEPIGDPTPVAGASGACWTAVDKPDQPGFLFVSSAGSSTIHGFTVNRPAGAPPSLTQAAGEAAAMLTPADPATGMLPDGFLGATDMAVTADARFLYVIGGTENDVRNPTTQVRRSRRWEIRGYRINGTKLDQVTPVSPPDAPPALPLPVGTQGIVAS